jgi:hypothetical protein
MYLFRLFLFFAGMVLSLSGFCLFFGFLINDFAMQKLTVIQLNYRACTTKEHSARQMNIAYGVRWLM